MQMNDTGHCRGGAQDVTLGARFIQLLALFNQLSASESLEIMYKAGITMPQLATLHALRFMGGHSVSLIAKKLKLSKAATSHLVDQLVRKGLVDRKEDGADRRRKLVKLTKQGEKWLCRLEISRKETFDTAIGLLPPELRSEFDKVLLAAISQLRDRMERQGKES